LKIAIKPTAPIPNWDYSKDFIDLGTTSFGSVPFALYASNVEGFDTKLNKNDTASMLASYSKLSNVNALVANKVNIADSNSVFVTPTQLSARNLDTTSISNRINLKANLASPIFTGNVTAPSFVKTGGLSTQYLMADGSVTTGGGNSTVNLGTSVTGVLPVVNGGTGQTTTSGILASLGFSSNNIAIGSSAGTANQGVNANTVAIGGGAGHTAQGQSAISIGYVAGATNQSANALAIGGNSAQANQASQAVALGYAAGQYSQGANAVALGAFAGNNGQVANSIAINATGSSLNPSNAGFYVSPIRSSSPTNYLLYYNTTTNEIVSATPSLVDLTTNQTIGGTKTFSSNIVVNGVNIGRGLGNNDESVAVGAGAMGSSNVNGKRNTAIGAGAMAQYNGTYWDNNTSVGYHNMPNMTSGSGNTSVGAESMLYLLTGEQNTSIGNQSLINVTGNNNVGVGKRSGQTISTGSQNTIVGTDADVLANNLSNASALGYGAIVGASNTIQLGNSSVTNVKTSGKITAGVVTYPNTDGAANQVLATNGSGVVSWSTPSSTSIASISNTSNANGAIISSGVLSLTPADATNGGIVTTSAQSMAGDKTFTGKVQVGVGAANASAALDVQSTTQGFLPPRMTYAQRNLISSPVAGLVLWCSNCGTSGELQVYNGSAWTNLIGGAASAKLPEVGDSYGGGIVTYIFQPGDAGYVAGQTHGLIIASADQSTGVYWGPNTVTGVTATALGTGSSNTDAIVASIGAGTYAAKICADLVEGGYSDWYLPSKDELYKMFLNRDLNGVGRSARGYFSSSEYTGSIIWLGWMDDGNFTTWSGGCEACKSQLRYVRAFRNF
jgi:hypothetical protein